MKNRRIVLASRPTGWVTEDNFRLETVELPPLAEGQVLVRNEWLSLDPYMRGRMNEGRSYAAAQPLNETMIGGTAGESPATSGSPKSCSVRTVLRESMMKTTAKLDGNHWIINGRKAFKYRVTARELGRKLRALG